MRASAFALLAPSLALLLLIAPKNVAYGQESSEGASESRPESGSGSVSALPGSCQELPDDAELRRRLDELGAELDDHEDDMRRWWTTFMLLHTGMGSASGVLAATAATDQARWFPLVGAISSTLALVTILAVTPPLVGAGDQLDPMPTSSPEERLRKLRAAEHLLHRQADATNFTRSFLSAGLSAAYVVAASLTLLFAFENPEGAILHSVGGAVLGIGRILLHPTGGRDAWNRYQRRYADADCAEISPEQAFLEAPEPAAGPQLQLAGLGLRLLF